MIRSYILINLNDGQNIKYARDTMSTCVSGGGVACSYYCYCGLPPNGILACQCCSAGQILCDYNVLSACLSCSLRSTVALDQYLRFPDLCGTTGCTCRLIRANKDTNTGSGNMIYTQVPAINVSSIQIVEEKIHTITATKNGNDLIVS